MADPFFTPTTDAAIASGASKMTIGGGSAAAAVGMLQGIDWMGLAGLMLAFIGVIITWYFKRRQDKRDAQHALDLHREHEMRMKQYEIEAEMQRDSPIPTFQVEK